MPELQVQHVIFTRVERAYSPRNASGYQVVYQSPTLGREVATIELRLQCFEAGRRKHGRYQFFWTERGQAVLAKSVSLLQPDPEVIDRGQRDAFLAHALVLSKEDFARVLNYPFAVFERAEEQGLFAEDEEQLVSYLREGPPPERLSVPKPMLVDATHFVEGWLSEDLWQLYRLGLQAPDLSRRGRSLLMLSEDPDEMFVLLSLVLMLLNSDERLFCTFDTCVDGCYPQAGTFWALGSSKGKTHPGLLSLHLSERRLKFKGGGDSFLDPKALMGAARLTEDFVDCARRDDLPEGGPCYDHCRAA